MGIIKPFTTPATFGSFTGVYEVESIYSTLSGDGDRDNTSIGSSMEGNCICLSSSYGLFIGDGDLSACGKGKGD